MINRPARDWSRRPTRFEPGAGHEAAQPTRPAPPMEDHTMQIDANDVAVSLIGPGEEMTVTTVPDGKVAIVLSSVAGQNVYVYGTPQVLRSLVADGLSAPVPADVPLFDDEGAL